MKRMLLLSVLPCLLLTGACAVHEDPSEGHGVKNLIYMIGDGMGLAHVSMLMTEADSVPTAFDRACNVALVKTRSANNRVTDSAAAGTALATGHKTDNGVLGQSPGGEPFVSIIERAVRAGRPTGEVTTCCLQHATPAAFYAHVADRDDYAAISSWLVRSGVELLFGGGADLLTAVQLDSLRAAGYAVVHTLDEAERLAPGRVAGLFAGEHLPAADAGRGDYLPRAAGLALELLGGDGRRSDDGFVLMVEGSQIDWAGHDNRPQTLLAELRDFERAVAVAMDFADTHPGTLVVVTADHETGGLTLPSNDADFRRSESGLRYAFSTDGHTGTLVPLYLYGTGAECINGILDNTELAQRLISLLGLE